MIGVRREYVNNVDVRLRIAYGLPMAKTAHIGVRLEPNVKDALDQAAEAEERSISFLAQKAIAEWLRRKGYLKDDVAAPKGRKR